MPWPAGSTSDAAEAVCSVTGDGSAPRNNRGMNPKGFWYQGVSARRRHRSDRACFAFLTAGNLNVTQQDILSPGGGGEQSLPQVLM